MGFRARGKNLGYDSAEHSGSLYKRIEDVMSTIIKEPLYGLGYGANKYGIMNAPDFQTLLGCFRADYYRKTELKKIMQSIINNTSMDFLSVYEKETVRFCNELMEIKIYNIKRMERENADCQQEIAQAKEMVKKLSAVKTIEDYDKNLAAVVKKHCAYLSNEYDAWRANLVKRPGYDKFIQELKQLYNTMFLEKMTDMGKGY